MTCRRASRCVGNIKNNRTDGRRLPRAPGAAVLPWRWRMMGSLIRANAGWIRRWSARF
jgi:hypothetical protein